MSLADIYMQIAGQNRADRERMREQLQSMAANVASIIQSNQQNAAANAALNKLEPPRAEAVNPQHPEAVQANHLFGGPTKPHTGGVATLDMYEKEQQLLDQQDARMRRRQAMDQAANRILGIPSNPAAGRSIRRPTQPATQAAADNSALRLSPQLAKSFQDTSPAMPSLASLPFVTTPEERAALPAGAWYRTADGSIVQKGN